MQTGAETGQKPVTIGTGRKALCVRCSGEGVISLLKGAK
jgi:hypothetical protein